jgi:hypothetical protein
LGFLRGFARNGTRLLQLFYRSPKNPVDLRGGIVVQSLDRMRVQIEREGDG